MRLFLYLILFLSGTTVTYAAKTPAAPVKHEKAVLKTDSSNVNIRHFDRSAIEKYKKSPEFQYKETVQDISWWKRFWRWFWSWLGNLFRFTPGRGSAFWYYFWHVAQIILLLMAGGALLLFILKSQGINLNILRKKSKSAPIPYSEFFEDINVIDFDTAIENAIAKANYRFAVRLLYLKCLKHLSEAGLIKWEIDKTNSAYINELSNNEQQAAFKQLTRQFEYVWYGEFLIDQQVYKGIDSSFRDFNKQVA